MRAVAWSVLESELVSMFDVGERFQAANYAMARNARALSFSLIHVSQKLCNLF